jgi:diguanylate cyclase (GGDEF)-like protein
MNSAGEQEQRHRILVVDDDPETGRLVRSWFEGQPFEVLVADGGHKGVKLALAERPDLILLDLRMPDMDGLAVARKLRSEATTRNIPVLMLTACRDVEHKVEAFSAGADDYVTKPFEFEEVGARIETMLRRREVTSHLETRVEDLSSTNEQLERLLVMDEKTGLFNFREFQRRLKEEWQRARRYDMLLSLVMLDLDHFKRLNDTLGHQAGDQVLREFAMLVAGGARGTDIAARYGGEEFAVVLPHTDAPMALRVAERIRKAVREFIFLDEENPTRITVSAGVATYPSTTDINSVDALVRAADMALYEAKKRGRNCVVQASESTSADDSA